MDGITLYQKIKEIDNNVIICLTTADKNLIKELEKGVIDIEKIVIYKPILLRDLRNRIDTLLVEHDYDDGDNNNENDKNRQFIMK